MVAHPDLSLKTPDIRPPGTGGSTTKHRTFFSQSLGPRGLRGGTQFAVKFVGINVGQELVQQLISMLEVTNVLGGQKGWEALLPEVMSAFDFAFCLRGGSVEQSHPIEVEGSAQLGKGVRGMGEEKGMVVHVKSQRKAVRLEGARQEIQVSQEGFIRKEPSANVVAGRIVQKIQQDLFIGLARQPRVG